MYATDDLLSFLPQAIDRELAARSLYEFVKQAWAIIEPTTPFVDGWHIQAICQHLEAVSRRQIRNLVINVPPGSTKSILTAVMWPAWEWVSRPSTRFLGAAYSQELVLRDAVRSRRIIDSSWYRSNWGDVFRLTTDQNTKGRFENNRTGVRISGSMDGGTTGEKGDILLLDDPHDVRKVDRPLVRENARLWWSEAFFNRVNDFKSGARVVIGQRSHCNDLFDHIEKQGGFEWFVIPEEFEPERRASTSIGWSDPRQTPGDWLRPERFEAPQKVEAIRELGDRGYAGQHQQRPHAREGNLFKKVGLSQIIGRIDFEELRLAGKKASNGAASQRDQEVKSEGKMTLCRYWDIAETAGRGDYTAGLLMGRTRKRRYYVIDVVRGHWGPDERDLMMRRTAEEDKAQYGAVTVVVEEAGNAAKTMSASFARLFEGFKFEVDRVSSAGSKEMRADPLASQCNQGNVYLVQDSKDRPWIEGFVAELLAFPAGAYDDMVDASSGAFNYLMKQSAGGNARFMIDMNHEVAHCR